MAGFDVDPEAKALDKIEHAPKRIAEIAALMLKDTPATDLTRGSLPWIKTRVVYPWFMRHQVAPRRFNVDNRCVGCRKCADGCPLSNISMEAGRPTWGDTCAFCLNCYHVCPTHAIDWKHTAARKGQYSLAALIKQLRR